MSNLLNRVSLTGPDDQTPIDQLAELASIYPFVEFALLYVPHNEGAPRNPKAKWRMDFFDAQIQGYSAIHLCGERAFEELLNGTLPPDVTKAGRIQLNVNARKIVYTDHEVMEIYKRSLDLGPEIILQFHSESAGVIRNFLGTLSDADYSRVHCLSDASKGTGSSPENWACVQIPPGSFVGYAGGLGPGKVLTQALSHLQQRAQPYWIDMETKIRTDNRFDIDKARQVLEESARFI